MIMAKKTALVLFTVLLISCNGQKSISNSDVRSFMDDYFEKAKQNDFNLIEPYYSAEFYEKTAKEAWEEQYNKIHSTYGTLVSVELTSWNMKSVMGTSGSGKYFTITYKNEYEKGYVSETIDIVIPKGDDTIKINGHKYDFAGSLDAPKNKQEKVQNNFNNV